MPKQIPEKLRPYTFHGVDLKWSDNSKEATADCPFCGREEKFSVNVDSGSWRCFICAEGSSKGGGNAIVFIRSLWKMADKETTLDQYRSLSVERRLLKQETLIEWGVSMSPLTNDWLVPGYNADGNLVQLYRYIHGRERNLLLPTPTLGHGLHGMNLLNRSCDEIYLAEGIWDAMLLREVFTCAKGETMDELEFTTDVHDNLLAEVSVLAVPGCTTFHQSWVNVFSGKRVNICFDNDYPRKHPKTGAEIEPAGYVGTKRIAGILHEAAEVRFLKWGDHGFTTEYPKGFDIGDYLCQS